jgi:hypothetical protein
MSRFADVEYDRYMFKDMFVTSMMTGRATSRKILIKLRVMENYNYVRNIRGSCGAGV